MALATIVGYQYQADLYCAECMDEIAVEHLNEAHALPIGWPVLTTETLLDMWAIVQGGIDRFDEATFDSGDFPKVVLGQQLEGEEHCGSCHEVLD